MMLDLGMLIEKYRLQIHGILHVGAHLGEEAQSYADHGILPVTWIEANPGVFHKLRPHVEAFGHRLFEGLVYETDDVKLPFHVTNYDGMSSSILEFGTHPEFSPDTVFETHLSLQTITIDTLVTRHQIVANFLVMDLQGAELYALKGAREFLTTVDYIMLEVNTAEVYVGCAQLSQLDDFLLPDFHRVETFMVRDQNWGDALWVRP